MLRALKANRIAVNSTDYIKHSDYSQRLVSCEWNRKEAIGVKGQTEVADIKHVRLIDIQVI